MGVEEELLVVDAESGRPLAVSERVLSRANGPEEQRTGGHDDEPGGRVEGELQQQQLEIDTPPRADLAELEDDLRTWRDVAVVAARREGSRIVASGTSPLPVEPTLVTKPRYARMSDRYGLTTAEHLTCGCHIHVSVDSDDEGVAVLDRTRVWLPALLALSANSPFWQGEDTGYASFRSQAVVRWPTAGPTDPFGSAEGYHRLVADMVESGVILDAGMVYFDARLSEAYPTVEVRAADVCIDARDTILLAALCRGLVDTAAAQWADGDAVPVMPTPLLRLATWQAGREGVEGVLLDPFTARPRPAAAVLADLVAHVRPALRATGDLALVEDRLEEVLTRGSGARRQRAVLEKTGQLYDVVADLARVTSGLDG